MNFEAIPSEAAAFEGMPSKADDLGLELILTGASLVTLGLSLLPCKTRVKMEHLPQGSLVSKASLVPSTQILPPQCPAHRHCLPSPQSPAHRHCFPSPQSPAHRHCLPSAQHTGKLVELGSNLGPQETHYNEIHPWPR